VCLLDSHILIIQKLSWIILYYIKRSLINSGIQLCWNICLKPLHIVVLNQKNTPIILFITFVTCSQIWNCCVQDHLYYMIERNTILLENIIYIISFIESFLMLFIFSNFISRMIRVYWFSSSIFSIQWRELSLTIILFSCIQYKDLYQSNQNQIILFLLLICLIFQWIL